MKKTHSLNETTQLRDLMEAIEPSQEFAKLSWVKVTTGGFGSPGPVVSFDGEQYGVRLDGEVHYFDPEELQQVDSGLTMTSGPDAKNFKNKPDHVTRRSGR